MEARGRAAPLGTAIRTSVADLALIRTTCPPVPGSGWPGAATVSRTLAARPGADSTRSVRPAVPTGFAATTPWPARGADPVMNAPGDPGGPPEDTRTALTGTLAVILIAPGIPPSDGIAIPVVR